MIRMIDIAIRYPNYGRIPGDNHFWPKPSDLPNKFLSQFKGELKHAVRFPEKNNITYANYLSSSALLHFADACCF